MPKYKVSVYRIGYAHLDIEVEADNPNAAEDLAVEKAGDHVFSEHDADYKADGCQEVA